jgi:two-component system response regulator HydG
VPVDCSGLVPTLIESELFGYVKGAFTGAQHARTGLLESAQGGTVFLDEIGDLPVDLQAKLLRALQEREIRPVGATDRVQINVRVIAATNRDLETAIRTGGFRQDLYFRLNVVQMKLPPLRERKSDIPLLVSSFLDKFSDAGGSVRTIAEDAMRRLMAYEWPGNVRELENAIERAVVLGESDVLLREDLPETVLDAPAPSSAAPGALQGSVTDVKRQLVIRAWEECHGDYKQAAAKLSIHPNSLLRLVRTLGLREILK